MRYRTFALAPAIVLAGAAICLPAVAQPIQPGLWEIKTTMTHSDKATQAAMAQAQKQLAAMPAEQRKQMEAIMAQQGLAMDDKGGMRVKSCVTPAEAEKFEVPAQQGKCTTTPAKRSGKTMRFSYQCTDPVSEGSGSVTFDSPTAYKMQSEHTTTVQGKTQKIGMEAQGRWLAADCAGALNDPAKNKRK